MPTIESLPRELRQHIFTLAFDYAISQDHSLNENIRDCIWSYDGMNRLSKSILEYLFYQILDEMLGPGADFLPVTSSPKSMRRISMVSPPPYDWLTRISSTMWHTCYIELLKNSRTNN
jgi:hypothetical protein